MFERMEIGESIYEGLVAPSHKNNWAESNRTVLSKKNRGEAAPSNTHPATDGSSGKCRKRCVYFLKSKSKIFRMHGPGDYSNEFKVLVGFGTKYAASQTTKYHEINPVLRKMLQKKKKATLLLTMLWMRSC